ncbi:MAG TPA: hypothetical protein VJU13_04865 [Candidatus Nitrosocosmicus sp.]|nr:hypothetical protein [Candidatus Nitrosocosmicus sp.]
MHSKTLQISTLVITFVTLTIAATTTGHNLVFAGQDIDQGENPPPDQNHVDVYDHQGQCIKFHKSYDKSVIDSHCKKN